MRLVAVTLVLALLSASAARGGEATCTITIAGRRDVVVPAHGGPGGIPSVDVRLLGPDVDLLVSLDGSQTIVIRDANGLAWRTSHGSARLDGPIQSRTLNAPVHVAQQAVFLPLDAIAELAGRTLVLTDRTHARLVRADTAASPVTPADRPVAPAVSGAGGHAAPKRAGAPAGWQTFEIAKTPEERTASARDSEDLIALREQRTVQEVQPPAHDALGIDVGLGFAQRGGAAFDVAGSGTVAGARLSLATFLTYGSDSATYRAGRVALESPAGAWTIEAGDLLSEARGLGRGLRLSHRIAPSWRPGVSVYVQDGRVPGSRPALSYRDSVVLHRNIDLRGEVSTDGSVFVATRLLASRGSVETFYRYTAWRDAVDRGVSVSYDVWHGISAYGGLRIGDGDGREHWQMLGLAVPLVRQSSISLEQTRNARGSISDTNRALGLQLPFGNVRLMQRFQWTDVAFVEGPSVLDTGRRQLQSMASYVPSSRLRFTYQVATQWFAGGEARQWTELESVFRLSARTSFHAVTGLPQFSSPQRLRVGLQQQLSRALRLSVDYGRLPAFESPLRGATNDPRLLVMVRRAIRVTTPAGGADVYGTVRDDSGAAVNGAVVALDRFLTTTRADGSYRFRHVPAGTHTLSLPADHLPAAYAVVSAASAVAVVPGTEVQADLQVTALRAIHGRVFRDANGNQRMDDGEALEDVVVRLDENGPATLTSAGGVFHFYNLQPGPYVVWLDTGRLRHDLQAAGGARRQVDLHPDRASTDVDFVVIARDKPVLMKELP